MTREKKCDIIVKKIFMKNDRKKARDILGEICKGILAAPCVFCGVGFVICLIGAEFPSAGFCFIIFISCLFAFWLVSTLSKISTKLTDTENHLQRTVALLENISNKLTPTETPAPVPVPVPVPTETSEQ